MHIDEACLSQNLAVPSCARTLLAYFKRMERREGGKYFKLMIGCINAENIWEAFRCVNHSYDFCHFYTGSTSFNIFEVNT